MGIYQVLVNGFNTVMAVFPGPLRWVLTVLILIAVIFTLVRLVASSWIFLIVLVLLLPVLLPLLRGVLSDLWNFVLFLLTQVGLRGAT